MDNAKKNLYILTDAFPYGNGEKTFIMPELDVLKEKFNIVIISTASQSVADQKDMISQLDDNILIYRFCPSEQGFVMYCIYFMQFWLRKVCLREVKEIVGTHTKVLYRIWKSMQFYARAEGIYYWIKKNNIISSQKGIYYSYWYNDKVLAISTHRNKYPELKVITRASGYDLFDERVEGTLRQPFKRIMDQNVDHIIFASNYGYRYYLQYIQKPPSDKYAVFKLGAQSGCGRSAKRKDSFFRIVSCSNLIPLKRVSLIVDALSLIHDVDIEWIHFGDGTERKRIERYAEIKLGKLSNIQYCFKGYVVNRQICEYYSEKYVHCFITLSSSEGGCPVSIQEAMAFGIPIIGTDVGGISEMIDGNGYLLNACPTAEDTAGHIIKICKLDEAAYIAMRENSLRIWKEEYDQIENARKYMEFLLSI